MRLLGYRRIENAIELGFECAVASSVQEDGTADNRMALCIV